mgnify:CR=1 FL=1
MRKDHNIFYLALYVGSAVGMVGSGIAVFLYQMLGSHTDLLNFLFGLFVLFFFVFLIVNIASFIKILMILYKDKRTDKRVDDNEKIDEQKKQPNGCSFILFI